MTYRSKAERIAYLKAEIEKIENTMYPSHLDEMRKVCIEALEKRIEYILTEKRVEATAEMELDREYLPSMEK